MQFFSSLLVVSFAEFHASFRTESPGLLLHPRDVHLDEDIDHLPVLGVLPPLIYGGEERDRERKGDE